MAASNLQELDTTESYQSSVTNQHSSINDSEEANQHSSVNGSEEGNPHSVNGSEEDNQHSINGSDEEDMEDEVPADEEANALEEEIFLLQQDNQERVTSAPQPGSSGTEVTALTGPSQSRRGAINSTLPIIEHRTKILELVNEHQVVMIEGETGCGKSTQVPQYIFEDCQMNQKPFSMIITQPRRVAAIKLAERVSLERGEPLGQTVGYSIGGETKKSPRTVLVYCTIGYLLQVSDSMTVLLLNTYASSMYILIIIMYHTLNLV